MTPHQVPKSHQVVPGAQVNIVLKADQRTGRQVRGIVQYVLTKGDHHRGIKVRLVDGRVGRVQSMALLAGTDSSAAAHSSTSMSPHAAALSSDGAAASPGPGSRHRYRDVRLDDALEPAPEQTDLGAYIVPPRRRGRTKKGTANGTTDGTDRPASGQVDGTDEAKLDVSTAVAVCPVCEAFQGDEAAVAHHVAEHFGS
ncbi:hypothetical protein F5Y17DRAFT_4661 [Xylariaceae sp. FL0594]|nr:hypothetical protein F5Y17DRAFT_4661 [Xylariaceae sp. FL0594]